MTIADTFEKFKAGWQAGNDININADVVVSEDLSTVKGVTITGVPNDSGTLPAITFSNTFVMNGSGISFNNVKIIFDGDIGIKCDSLGIEFNGCEIEAGGSTFVDIARVPSTQVAPSNFTFTNCNITCANAFAMVGKSEYAVGGYSHYSGASRLSIEGGSLVTGSSDPFTVSQLCKGFRLSISPVQYDCGSAQQIVLLNADGAEIFMSQFAIPEDFIDPASDKFLVRIAIDKKYPALNTGRIQISNIDENYTDCIVVSNAAAPNGNPGGYAVFCNSKGITFTATLFNFDWVTNVEDLKIALQMIEYLSTSSKNAVLNLSTPITTDKLTIASSFVNLVGNLTVDELVLDHTVMTVTTGGTLTVNKKLLMDNRSLVDDDLKTGALSIPNYKGEYPIRGPFNSSALAVNPILDGTVSGSNSFTNATLQLLINKFGNRIFMIVFDNNYKVSIGYSSSQLKNVNDIILDSVGGVDMIGIRHYVPHPNRVNESVSYVTWKLTSYIQQVSILDEDMQWRPDIIQVM